MLKILFLCQGHLYFYVQTHEIDQQKLNLNFFCELNVNRLIIFT